MSEDREHIVIGGHDIPVVSIDEAKKILDGAEIITPQFERERGYPKPSAAPIDWDALHTLSREQLRDMGLRPWNDPNEDDEMWPHQGIELWLFPGEWYGSIPEEFTVMDINGIEEPFRSGDSDDDIRFGCLPYGIAIKATEGAS